VPLGIREALERTGRRLFWVDPNVGSGIARHVPWFLGPAFEARVKRFMDAELKRFVARRRRKSSRKR
jgi:hypothetical protein